MVLTEMLRLIRARAGSGFPSSVLAAEGLPGLLHESQTVWKLMDEEDDLETSDFASRPF